MNVIMGAKDVDQVEVFEVAELGETPDDGFDSDEACIVFRGDFGSISLYFESLKKLQGAIDSAFGVRRLRSLKSVAGC